MAQQSLLPLSLTQPFRKGQLIVGAGWRAFFAPFNQVAAQGSSTLGPTIVDLQTLGPFNQGAMPLNFADLGWITDFKRTPGSKIGQIRSGYRGAVRAQYRGEVGETFEFSFHEMTRLAYRIATGTEVFNLLVTPNGTTASQVGPMNASGISAVPLAAAGYLPAGVPGIATPFNGANVGGVATLMVPAGSGANFPAGSYIVCDQDYAGQYGLVGAAGVNVFQGATTDVDLIRKTSDFVARVVTVVPGASLPAAYTTMDALVLDKPFVGGGNAPIGVTATIGPSSNSKVQLIKGYMAREGGSFISDWTGIFVMNTIDGSQIVMYYPHVSPNQYKDMSGKALENAGTTDLMQYTLDCVMTALAFDDPFDGETVVSYCAYYPTASLNPGY